MKPQKADLVAAAAWLAAAVFLAFNYHRLPTRVIMHWGPNGEANGWGSPISLVALGLGLPLAVYALFLVLPRIDPRAANYARFGSAYGIIRLVIVLFLIATGMAALLPNLGYSVPIERIVPIGIGLMFIAMGDVMAQIRFNYFVGVRTPWTLANEEVWRRTHRIGAYSFVLGGVVAIVGGLVGPGAMAEWIIAATVVAGLVPAVYSYFAYRQVTRTD